MLPPGHIAGGYLTSKLLQKALPYTFTTREKKILSFCGAFFGFMPDLDFFYAFAKAKSWIISTEMIDHRTFLTHTPLPWMILGLLVFTLAKKPFAKAIGLLLWLGTWSHLILDSIEHGVRWLWPFSKHLYAIAGVVERIDTRSAFVSFWGSFLTWYATHSITFYFEGIIILVALYVFYKSNKAFFAK